MTSADKDEQTPEGGERLVWDLPVRLFHGALAASVVAALVTNKLGVSFFKYHVWSGYAVLVLVLFRILWGVVGTRHARFWNFLRGPAETLRYARALLRGEGPSYAGHNPLGALMVVALLAALAVQAVIGLFGNDEIFNVGPLYGYVDKDLSLELTSLHRRLFLWIGGAVALHMSAVFAHQLFHGENLVKAMITGRKPEHVLGEREAIRSSRLWLAVLLVAALSGGLAAVVAHAPVAEAVADSY